MVESWFDYHALRYSWHFVYYWLVHGIGSGWWGVKRSWRSSDVDTFERGGDMGGYYTFIIYPKDKTLDRSIVPHLAISDAGHFC